MLSCITFYHVHNARTTQDVRTLIGSKDLQVYELQLMMEWVLLHFFFNCHWPVSHCDAILIPYREFSNTWFWCARLLSKISFEALWKGATDNILCMPLDHKHITHWLSAVTQCVHILITCSRQPSFFSVSIEWENVLWGLTFLKVTLGKATKPSWRLCEWQSQKNKTGLTFLGCAVFVTHQQFAADSWK